MLLSKWSHGWSRRSCGLAPLCVFDRGGIGDSKTPSLPESKKELEIQLPLTWSWLADGEKCLGAANDKVNRPGRNVVGKKGLGRPVHQNEGGLISF